MIKGKIVIISVLTLLAMSIAGKAVAQSTETESLQRHKRRHRHEAVAAGNDAPRPLTRKEMRRMERLERKKLKRERKQRRYRSEMPYEEPPVHIARKKTAPSYPKTILKPMYRIDVLMPMYLDELVNGGSVTFQDKLPEKAMPGMSFYEGINIAADSLKKAGFNIDIYIHDIASVSESPDLLVSKGKLDSSDLIIGAVLSKDIPVLAEYAKNKRVNFISALSASDGGVKDNPYVTLVQPSLKSHCEWIVGDIAQKFPGQKITVLYRRSPEVDNNSVNYITNAEAAGKLTINKLDCSLVPAKASLLKYIDTSKPNVIIIPILDNGHSDSILKELTAYFPSTHFEIYGMPSWNNIANLNKKNAFPNLSINITCPFNFDASSTTGKYIARAYKKDYSNKPGELVYRGYETLFWYANLLKQYGTVFNDKYADNASAPFTKFEIKQQWDKDGKLLYNENTHIFLSTYEGGANKIQ